MANTISVVIPCYNSKDLLLKALESVQAQTVSVEEVIVVDDGSTENLSEVVEKFPFAKILRQENKGVSAARNLGVRTASGEWIAFLDCDDTWMPRKIEAFKALIKEDPDLTIVGSNIIAGNDSVGWKEIDFKSYFDSRRNSFEQLFYKNFLVTSSVVAKKEVLQACGLFDESLSRAEDYELWLRVAKNGKIGMIFEPLTRYLSHPEGLSKNAFELYRSTFYVVLEWKADVGMLLFWKRCLRIILGYLKSVVIGFKY